VCCQFNPMSGNLAHGMVAEENLPSGHTMEPL
jgi:hypothetical protein